MLNTRKDIDFFEKGIFPYKARKKKNFVFKTKKEELEELEEESQEESEEERFK